jgi:hypothetical protein
MGIESYLGTEDKLSALTEFKTMIAKEIYISCINCGIDPDTFDYAEYLLAIEQTPTINFGVARIALFDLCKKLQVVENKIAGL